MWKGGLSFELVGELLLPRHYASMRTGRQRHSGVALEGRDSDPSAGLIGHFQELLLSFLVEHLGGRGIRGDRTIRTLGGRRLNFRLLRRCTGSKNQRHGSNQGPTHQFGLRSSTLGGSFAEAQTFYFATG